jgi:hypothetical protein
VRKSNCFEDSFNIESAKVADKHQIVEIKKECPSNNVFQQIDGSANTKAIPEDQATFNFEVNFLLKEIAENFRVC